jgi:hypothetical protein
MKIRKEVFFAVFGIFCLTTVIFMVIPIMGGVGDYDPWIDTNDDGKIDMKDVAVTARAFGTYGTPINKTEVLLQHEARIGALEGKVGPLKVLATGFVMENATVLNGYNIAYAVFNPGPWCYEFFITGVDSYEYGNFSVYVEPVYLSGEVYPIASPVFFMVNWPGGAVLRIYCYSGATRVRHDFSFIVYKLS